MRYSHKHLEYLHKSKLKNRRQKRDESLQEYEVDIARLARFAYPSAPENMMECLGFQAFIDGLREPDMQRALRLAHPKTLVDSLTAALGYEAATKASGYNKVRTIQEQADDVRLDQIVNLLKGMADKKPKKIKCRKCGELEYVRSAYKRPRTSAT